VSGNGLRVAFVWLLYLVVTFISGAMFQLTLGKPNVGYFLLFILLLVMISYGTTAIHEIGHVIAGKLNGLKFRFIVIGPLFIQSKNGRLRIYRNIHARSVGGLTGMVVPDTHNLRRRLMLYVAGGPATNLLFAIIAAAGTLAFAHSTGNLLPVIFLSASLLSFATFMISILPARTKGLTSDGQRIVDLLRNNPRAARWSAIIAIGAMYERGQRPRDWNPYLVQQVTLSPDEALDYLTGLSLGYYYQLDSGQVDAAGMWLDKIAGKLNHLAGVFRASFQLELAYFTALHRRDAAKGRLWLNQAAGRVDIARITRLRAEAAVLLAEGKSQECLTKATEGLAALDLVQNMGLKVLERD